MENNNTKHLVAVLVVLTAIAFPYLWEQLLPVSIGENPFFEHTARQDDPFEGLQLEAKAVYVFDMPRGVPLYARNENEALPLASLAKMMTAIVATDLVPQSTVVTINGNDIGEEGDSGLLVGEKWRMSDIIDFTLMTSSNDGASAIASVAGSLGQNAYGVPTQEAKIAFIEKMNAKTQEVGLTNTYFRNETGLDIGGGASGAYGTAREVAMLLAYAVKNKIDVIEATSLDRFTVSSLNSVAHMATNTNEVANNIPGLIASKTGFTDLAGGNLVVAFDAGLMHPIVISVMGSSREGRFEDMGKLVRASLKSLSLSR